MFALLMKWMKSLAMTELRLGHAATATELGSGACTEMRQQKHWCTPEQIGTSLDACGFESERSMKQQNDRNVFTLTEARIGCAAFATGNEPSSGIGMDTAETTGAFRDESVHLGCDWFRSGYAICGSEMNGNNSHDRDADRSPDVCELLRSGLWSLS